MVQIQTELGEMQARVFIERGEQALGIVIEQNGQVIGCNRFDEQYINDVLVSVRQWLNNFQLCWGEKGKLVRLVREEHTTLRQIRREGVSPSVGWLGSEMLRTLPETPGFCALA